MAKLGDMMTGLRTFVDEVKVELKKCSWPTRPELVESTVVVIISVLILAAYVAVGDSVIGAILNFII